MTKPYVSRCCRCRHWTNNKLLGGNGGDLGTCRLTVNDTGSVCCGKKNQRALARQDLRSGAYLETHATFGCIQFEAGKPAYSDSVKEPKA